MVERSLCIKLLYYGSTFHLLIKIIRSVILPSSGFNRFSLYKVIICFVNETKKQYVGKWKQDFVINKKEKNFQLN